MTPRSALSAATLPLCVWIACSASDEPAKRNGTAGAAGGDASTGTGGAGGTGGTSGAGGSGGSAAGGGGGTGGAVDAAPDAPPDVSFGYDASVPDADACAATVVEAKLTPLSMYVLLDRSGSMTFSNKWNTAVSAIGQFVSDPKTAGMKIALQYFPLEQGHDCTGGGYATPAVAMGLLPGHATAINASLSAEMPTGTFTPLEGALNGIANYSATYAGTPPGSAEKVVGLLLTDGIPDGPCDNTTAGLAAIAAAAYGGTPSIPVYVLGMSGADFNVLGQIAAAGGTSAAYSVTSGGAAAFFATLQDIQLDAVGCEYALPKPEGGVLDPSKVEVLYASGGAPQTLPHQPGVGTCGGGWHFDDNQSPTVVRLCPSTCNIVKADAQAKIELNLGCLGA